MLYRTFGKTDKKVSILGFGCMRLPVIDGVDANIDEAEAIKMIRHAIDHGVTYIDTAYPYHGGNSETVVGKALKDGYREKVMIATKLPSWKVEASEDMDRLLDEQLARLQTDHIDFYLLHALESWYWGNYKKLNVADFVKRAKASGKIKNIGFSFHDELPVFKTIVDEFDWDFCMVQYNYMDEDFQAGKEGLLYAHSKGLGVAVMEPLKGGTLSNNLPDDIQNIWNRLDEKRSPAAWGLRHVWDQKQVSVVMSGMSDMEQVNDNINTAKDATPGCLNEAQKSAINDVRDIYRDRIAVDCTACQYCMPCPHGVNIPLCFEYLNNHAMYQNEQAMRQYSIFVEPENKADKCQECGICEQACPQHIAIIDKLKETATKLAEK
jgi:uncharacterized protein